MPMVTEPPRFGFALDIPFSPTPLVWAAPASPSRPPTKAAPAPSASPPAMNDRRSKDCVIANPQGLDPHCVQLCGGARYNFVTVSGWQAIGGPTGTYDNLGWTNPKTRGR